MTAHGKLGGSVGQAMESLTGSRNVMAGLNDAGQDGLSAWAQRRTHKIVFFRESELTSHDSGISLQHETEGLKRRTDSVLEVRRRRAQVMLDRRDG